MTWKRAVFSLLLVLNVLIVYSNHFGNDFQFDDANTIAHNPAIEHPATIFRAFIDPTLFSVMPEQRNYRPVTTASLALDYWLAGGAKVFFFHLSTFFWFSIQLVLMFLLFERIMTLADPHPSNFWTALAAAAVFGLHPANAETVNYIIQRADIFNALGCVASLWLFIRYPEQRKFGWYLLPAVLGMLAKAPALVFPLLLAGYLWLFERADRKRALGWMLAATGAAAAVGILLARMQSSTWTAGGNSPFLYRITQPYVTLHYFKSFFLPTDLNVDPGWHYLAPLSGEALAGYGFVLALLVIIVAASRTPSAKPVAFGMFWFLATLLPTALVPLSDVTNDHRMYFAFVGLALGVVWSLRLALFSLTDRLTVRPSWSQAAVGAMAVLLLVAGVATRTRNRIWLTPQSLWWDSVAKNPLNPRALSNYGAAAYDLGDYDTALVYWQRAAALDPATLHYQGNLVRASQQLHRADLQETYLKRIVGTAKPDPETYLVYGEFLASLNRFDEAISILDRASQFDPNGSDLKLARGKVFASRDAMDRSLVFRTLDTDHDLRLSAAELAAAPVALLTLDRDGNGRLSARECGVARQRMRFDPVLDALDANHDGEISAAEIRNAQRALEGLGREHRALQAMELLPEYVVAAAQRMMATLDSDRDGRIEPSEWSGSAGAAFRGLLIEADTAGDGTITLEELANEIFFQVDRNRDGVVSRQELAAAIRAGLIGPISVSAEPVHTATW